MQAAWKVENAKTEKRTVYLNAQGQEVKNLTRTGTAKCRTEAQRGARPSDAVDGKPDTYCAVGSGASWSGDLPKDIGMEWKAAVEVGCFQIDYHDKSYAPASDGHQLQAWDGANWQPVAAKVAKDASGANWTYTFKPFKTTRIRVFITKFNPHRTAVREMRIFAEPAVAEQREVRVPLSTKGPAAFDVDGDKRAEILVAAGNLVKCIKGDGTVLWQRELPKAALCVDACDLDGDGKGEVVVGGEDHKLYCFDHKGNERWSVLTPADPYFPEIEPATGPVRVVKCGDINGDGKGQIVLGSGNWFAYAFDHTGKKLWGALNWAHQPTSICFVPLGRGTLGALIGTTYNDANLFGLDGKKLQNVSVGYHGAAMSVAAGEMDGSMKLIAGSRIGGLHCVELGGEKSWAKFMGAEVTQVAMADLNGDGKKEIIAGSKNFHVLGSWGQITHSSPSRPSCSHAARRIPRWPGWLTHVTPPAKGRRSDVGFGGSGDTLLVLRRQWDSGNTSLTPRRHACPEVVEGLREALVPWPETVAAQPAASRRGFAGKRLHGNSASNRIRGTHHLFPGVPSVLLSRAKTHAALSWLANREDNP